MVVGEIGFGIVRLRDYQELAIVSMCRIHGWAVNPVLADLLYSIDIPLYEILLRKSYSIIVGFITPYRQRPYLGTEELGLSTNLPQYLLQLGQA
jgi:hypothetical protein